MPSVILRIVLFANLLLLAMPAEASWRDVNCGFLFGGKERLTPDGMNEYDQTARRYVASFPRFTTPDAHAGITPWLSPYAFCGSDPINAIDPTGNWYIRVSASSDREKYPYATLRVYNTKDVLVFKTIVKVRGTHRNRQGANGDTPIGKSKIEEWRKTGEGTKYNEEAYGKNDLLALKYEEGEAAGSGRFGMHLYGGRPNDGSMLMGTHGCIRISDEDIKELKTVTDKITARNPDDGMEDLEVLDDLETPVDYSDGEDYRKPEYKVELAPIIIYYKSNIEY